MAGETDNPDITLVCCGLIGSVVADDGVIERCFAEAIATQGVVSGTSAFARRMTQVHQARGQAPADVLRLLFPDNEARAQAALLAFERALGDALRRIAIQPLPGAVQVLDQIRASGRRIFLLSTLPPLASDHILDSAGLRPRIDGAVTAGDVSRGFPAPDLVLTALMRSRTGSVAEVAVVHSTGAGVESGRRSGAGLIAGLLSGPHAAARLRSAGATAILRGITDLPGALPPPALPPPARRPASAGAAARSAAVRPGGVAAPLPSGERVSRGR